MPRGLVRWSTALDSRSRWPCPGVAAAQPVGLGQELRTSVLALSCHRSSFLSRRRFYLTPAGPARDAHLRPAACRTAASLLRRRIEACASCLG